MGCAASVPSDSAPAAPKKGSSDAAPANDLGTWLRRHELSQYEDALRDSLGASSVDDLREMVESDWVEVGLKKLEVKKAVRLVRELNCSEEGGSLPGSPGPIVNPHPSSAVNQGAADDQAPAKAKEVVQDVPPESRAEAAANDLVGRVEGAREAVEERVEQGQARVDETTMAHTAIADAEESLLGTEVRLTAPAPSSLS